MDKYTKSSIFDSLEERYQMKKTDTIVEVVSIIIIAFIVSGLMFLTAKQFNLF